MNICIPYMAYEQNIVKFYYGQSWKKLQNIKNIKIVDVIIIITIYNLFIYK
jgi:hypothetical protein